MKSIGIVLVLALSVSTGRAQQSKVLKNLVGHNEYVWCVAVSADGGRAVSGSADHSIKYWDLQSGQCIKTLTGHTKGIWSVVLSADGKFALSGSYDHTLKFWNLQSGQCLKTLTGHTSSVRSVALSTDGKYALSGSWDKTIRYWDLRTGRCLKMMAGHTDSVFAVGISANGRYGISGSDDKTMKYWDLQTGKCIRTLAGHRKGVYGVALSNDGKFAISGSADHTLKYWNLQTGKCIKTLVGHTGDVNTVAISPNGRFVLSGSWDHTLKYWDLRSGQCVETLVGHEDGIWSAVLLRDGEHALSASWDKSLKYWDIRNSQDARQALKALPVLVLENVVFNDANHTGFIEADERCTLNFDLINKGQGPAFSVQPTLAEVGEKSGILLPLPEFITAIEPGGRRSFKWTITGTQNQKDLKTTLTLTALEKNGFDADPVQVAVHVQAFRPPKIEVVDSKFSSLTGVLQPGVTINLKAAIQNTGIGAAEDVKVKLVLPAANVFLSGDEEIRIPVLKQGESKILDFELVANKRYTGAAIPCSLTVSEKHGKYGSIKVVSAQMNQRVATPQTVEVEVKEMKPEPFAPIVLNSDVDKDLPISKTQNPDAIAVVIGNQHYLNTKPVDFASNDAASVKNYLVQVLGFREGNIIYLNDATLTSFYTVFGRDKQKGKLHDRVKPGISDVFVYYSGHGAPDLGEGSESKGYIVPVECDPNYVAQGGYALETLYGNLNRLPAKTITVVLDACFSGEDLIQKASPMVIRPRYPEVQKAMVLASGKETQVSNWYVEQQHGLFTYFFLKAIQQKELSDKNKDGKLSMEEIYQFVGDQAEGVPYHSRVMYGGAREQTPMLLGVEKGRILVDYGR